MHLLVVEDERILCETIVRSLRCSLFSMAQFHHPFVLSAIIIARES